MGAFIDDLVRTLRLDPSSTACAVRQNASDNATLEEEIGKRGYAQNKTKLHALTVLPSRAAARQAHQNISPGKSPTVFLHLGALLLPAQ